jgi:glycosyltransferase involved in cell wall biosynthesis
MQPPGRMPAYVSRELLVSIQTTNERGGAEYANVDLLEALAARGHDVLLLTNLPDLATDTVVPVRKINLGPKLAQRSLLRVALQAPLTLTRIARALRAEQPVGTLALHFKKEQLLCSLLPRRLTGKIVWFEWGPVPLQMRKGLPRFLYALAARRASRILAVSEGTRRTVVDAGVPRSKVDVIPNLVDVDAVGFDAGSRAELRAAWGASENTIVVGCISRFHHKKRNEVVIDAMSHIEGDVKLVLAGEGSEEQLLRERAAPYGDRVRFVENVRGYVEGFLSACDLLVFAPSPTEGAPRVIVMAQLVGVPVIATDAEGTEGLISPGGGTVVTPSHDPLALAKVIAAYRDDNERRQREGATAQKATRDSHNPERTLRAVEQALGLPTA